MKLKADLHLHTSEGPERFVRPDARTLIDRAAQEGYRVLAITNHNTLTYSEAVKTYAWERGRNGDLRSRQPWSRTQQDCSRCQWPVIRLPIGSRR